MTEGIPTGGFETETLELPGWTHVYSGKVRDLYVPVDETITANEYTFTKAGRRFG